MIKKLIFTVLLILSFCILTACDPLEDSISKGTDNSRQGVKSSQIKADVEDLETVQNGVIKGYFMPVEKYEVSDISVVKRQTNLDKKQDLVFCSVVIANTYVQTTLQYTMEYNYYDQGGWILDNATLTSNYSKPLKGVTESLVCPTRVNCENMTNYEDIQHAILQRDGIGGYREFRDYIPSKFKLTKHQTNLETATDTLIFTYSDHHYEMSGYEKFNFDQVYGWVSDDTYYGSSRNENGNIEVTINNIIIDWDKALSGLFAYKDDPNGNYIRLSDRQGNGVVVDFYCEYSPNCQYTYANKVTGLIDASTYSLSFTATHYYKFSYSDNPYSDRDVTLFYNFCEDVWHGSSTYTYGNHMRVE